MTANSFYADCFFEKECLKYLKDKGFLNKIGVVKIVEDAATQKRGIDLICRGKNDEYYVDVKSVASIKLPTFCFEVMNTTSRNEGWLTSPDFITTHYLLTYHEIVNATHNYNFDKPKLRSDNIINTHIILVSKKKIKELLTKEFGMPNIDEFIREKAKEIYCATRADVETHKTYKVENGELVEVDKDYKKIRFRYTGYGHDEHPINIVIPRYLLDSIACKTWDIR